ncbi:hypothetical protein Pen02_04080 [Plantactinospora endophytica]|uniref:FtsX extracellular domain-containing protein n=1 Tax=Plantactinospora endophytica TaxID=673535 RepID=A0ABQ4DTM8_9ACTN|nr:hypothetical protein Pen02_04080 [Plantactinospora endophytica]
MVLGVLLVVGLAGSTPPPADARVSPPISVFLADDVTEPQKRAVEARLRAVPDLSELVFESREQAYARFAELFEDEPAMVEQVQPEDLPESFRFTLRDRAAFDRTVAGPLPAELRELASVDDVVYPGGPKQEQESVSRCVHDFPALPAVPGMSTSVPLDVRVMLDDRISEADRRAVEARLRAVPGATGVRLETAEQAAARFRELFADVPETAGLGRPELLGDSLLLRLADETAVARANDTELDVELCRMPGVELVSIPPKILR